MDCILDAEIHLAAKGLSATITSDNTASSQDKAKAIIFLRHYLDEGLKVEHLTVKDPLELWSDLKKMIIFQLKLCGKTINDEDMMKKILTTFHQYREKGFQKYSEFILCLLVAEQHNVLLMKNHEARPTGVAPLLKANGVQATGRMNDGRLNILLDFIKNLQKKENEGVTSSNARMESHLTFKNDNEAGTSQKYDDNIEANLILKDDDFDGLDDITYLEVEDFFGDQN
ncbi:uncharacterized protein LOC107844447 [Capsicum annuum]|uniref:uncharacterized protein LOC107844447 n=1 Tax=Capsicum annuum TaxID=4072 RepID=UPI001FB05199|nr:uncharacterized protein LOC107844447 [Capsicum annuum]